MKEKKDKEGKIVLLFFAINLLVFLAYNLLLNVFSATKEAYLAMLFLHASLVFLACPFFFIFGLNRIGLYSILLMFMMMLIGVSVCSSI